MVKRDPDDIISALSKNLRKENPQTMRLTFKRSSPHFQTIAKAHSRIAKRNVRRAARDHSNQNPDQIWPLYVRYKESVEGKQTKENKDERIRRNSAVNQGKGHNFIGSLLGAFRVNFYKKKQQEVIQQKKGPTPIDPNSKSSKKKNERNNKNKERRQKRKQIAKSAKAELKARKQSALKDKVTTEQHAKN